jgi:hypothetical protein
MIAGRRQHSRSLFRDPWPCICLEMGSPVRREEGFVWLDAYLLRTDTRQHYLARYARITDIQCLSSSRFPSSSHKGLLHDNQLLRIPRGRVGEIPASLWERSRLKCRYRTPLSFRSSSFMIWCSEQLPALRLRSCRASIPVLNDDKGERWQDSLLCTGNVFTFPCAASVVILLGSFSCLGF